MVRRQDPRERFGQSAGLCIRALVIFEVRAADGFLVCAGNVAVPDSLINVSMVFVGLGLGWWVLSWPPLEFEHGVNGNFM